MATKYSFLYSNYSPRHPYWETTEMLRKFAIAFIPVSTEGAAGALRRLFTSAARLASHSGLLPASSPCAPRVGFQF